MSYCLRSGEDGVRIPRWPAIKRLATVSVVNGLPELGEVERIRAGDGGAAGSELVEGQRVIGTPSERWSLPMGFCGVRHE